jgi:Ca2+-transporting ATPase
MFQRLLLTTSLSGGQWVVVLGLALLAPAFVAVDKAIQLRRLDRESQASPLAASVGTDGR